MARRDQYAALVEYVKSMCMWTMFALGGVGLIVIAMFLPGVWAAVTISLGGAFVLWGIIQVLLERPPRAD